MTEQKTGHITADTLQSKVTDMYTLAAEVRYNRRPIPAGIAAVSGTRSAVGVACLQGIIRVNYLARDQVRKASGISVVKGHE